MSKYYTVREWKEIWVFDSREKCKELVQWFSWAKYKSFSSKEEAEIAFQKPYTDYYQSKKSRKDGDFDFEKNSIAVDAACSWNPGKLEYQWVNLLDWQKIFYKNFSIWTNNIWEFLAIVEWLKYLYKKNSDQYLYSDSKHAISWIQQKSCKTKLEKTENTERIFEEIKEAENRLNQTNYSTKILKRNTKEWGEIPADFNRK